MFTDRKVFFTFFKVFCVFASVFILFSVLTSCCFASSDSSSVPASSCTVGKFTDRYHRVDVWVDPDTGVNYLLQEELGRGGICPRYNADGSLFVSEGVS